MYHLPPEVAPPAAGVPPSDATKALYSDSMLGPAVAPCVTERGSVMGHPAQVHRKSLQAVLPHDEPLQNGLVNFMPLH